MVVPWSCKGGFWNGAILRALFRKESLSLFTNLLNGIVATVFRFCCGISATLTLEVLGKTRWRNFLIASIFVLLIGIFLIDSTPFSGKDLVPGTSFLVKLTFKKRVDVCSRRVQIKHAMVSLPSVTVMIYVLLIAVKGNMEDSRWAIIQGPLRKAAMA